MDELIFKVANAPVKQMKIPSNIELSGFEVRLINMKRYLRAEPIRTGAAFIGCMVDIYQEQIEDGKGRQELLKKSIL